MADANSVANKLDGSDGSEALDWALAAMLYEAKLFGLADSYAYPEGSNTSSSRLDQITTLAKLLTRTYKHADGRTYDLWDAVQTICQYVLKQAPDLNDDEDES